MSADDRRATLEAVAFGDDGRITPGDRLRAIEQLSELDQRSGATSTEHLTPEEELRELAAFGMPAATAMAIGPEAVEAPVDPSELGEVIELQERLIEALEQRLAATERALQRWTSQRLLPRAPELMT